MRKVKVAGLLIGALLAFYIGFINHVEPYRAGIVWNRISGELTLQDPGIHFTMPWVAVSTIDTRPTRVCVTSAGRGFNCLLVQFNASAYKEFVAVQGFQYYWLANRLSFNFGYDEEYRGMKDILRGYAYSKKEYPFISVLLEYDEDGE